MEYQLTDRASKHTAFAWMFHDFEADWKLFYKTKTGSTTSQISTDSVEKFRADKGYCPGSINGIRSNSPPPLPIIFNKNNK